MAPASAKVFDPTYFRLANGLEVVVIENHRVPAAVHMLWYKVGAADETAGQSGIAHLFEHLMFKGTETTPPGAFSDLVHRNGGRENAFTSWDQTGYFQVVPKALLGDVMALEADRMTGLTLTHEQIETERDVVLEEWNDRVGQSPSAQLSQAMSAALFRNHPYGRPIIGWRHEIEALTADQIRAFYRRYYAPDNAVLVVAGDVEPAAVRALAEQHYGTIPAANNPPAARPQEPPLNVAQRVQLRDPRVTDPRWRRVYLAPSYHQGESEHAYALQVLSEILGDRSVGRLAKNLTRTSEVATAAGSYYSPSQRGPATFFLYANPTAGTDLATLEAAVDAEIKRLLADGVTAEEVEATKRRLLAAAVYARDSLSGGARTLGEAVANGGRVEDVEAWPARIGAVTADDIMAAARHVLRIERSVTGELLPEEPQS